MVLQFLWIFKHFLLEMWLVDTIGTADSEF